MSIGIEVRNDFLKLWDSLDDLGRKQLPFAAATAINETARRLEFQADLTIRSVFDRPTPFTQRAVGHKLARKDDLVAEVFIRPVQAQYLAPSIVGSRQLVRKTALLNPRNITLDRYGNIPRGTLRKLKARRDVFIGKVKAKDGQALGGIWQRGPHHSIRFLALFGQGVELTQRFNWDGIVRDTVGRVFGRALDDAMTKALETAQR